MYLKLRTILHNNNIYYILLVLSLVIFLIFTKVFSYESKYNINEKELTLKVTNYTIYKDKITFEFIGKEKIIGTYYIKNKDKNNYNIKLGDTLKINGKLNKVNKSTNFNAFDYNKYLYNKKIFYKINIYNFEVIENNNNILYGIKNLIINHINNYQYSKNYLYVFILGNKDYLDNKIIDSYNANGISHLFSISGMHLSIFTSFLYLILKKVNVTYKNIIIILCILIYMFITSNTSSILRAGIFSILCIINKNLNLDIKLDNLLYFELFVLIIINPFIVYDIGFQFSYIISLTLIKSQNIIKAHKSKLYKMITISLISFLISLPICINNFNQISIMSILNNLFFVPFITTIVFPFSIITFIFPIFDNGLYMFTNVIENVSLYLYNIKQFIIVFAKANMIIIIIYYIIIILAIKNLYKNNLFIIILIICLFIHKNILLFNFTPYYIIIDVSQGDSSLIVLPNNKGNILIDTGGSLFSNYNIAQNTLIPLFKSLGINKLDYIILTHGDFDHMGEAINLVNNIKIEKVIFNCGSYNDLEKELIKVLDKKKIKYYSCIKELNINKNKLYFLQTKVYDNENDNSNVIITELNGYKFMFMGDAGVEVEEDLIKKYNLQDIDVLKVGHHGSKTSSSKNFVNEINPKYSIISVGKNNRYGHPNDSVLNNLENSRIYRTDQDGSIMFKIENDKLQIETCSP